MSRERRAKEKFPLLPRKKRSDKKDYGHTLVLAGSGSMAGAATLTSHAALVSGSGLVTLGAPKSVLRSLKNLAPEVMRFELPETAEQSLARPAYSKIIRFVLKRRITCIALGPGLSRNPQTGALVRRLVGYVPIPIVLDADGLNSFEGHLKELPQHLGALVMTPHRREFERLFSKKWPENLSERAKLAKKLCRFYDGVLVLKGHRTLVADASRFYKNKTGNPGMAKGGTGDVLTGLIASFISQGLGPYDAARWAVYFHGRAGDRAAKVKSELGVLASDLIRYLPEVFVSKH